MELRRSNDWPPAWRAGRQWIGPSRRRPRRAPPGPCAGRRAPGSASRTSRPASRRTVPGHEIAPRPPATRCPQRRACGGTASERRDGARGVTGSRVLSRAGVRQTGRSWDREHGAGHTPPGAMGRRSGPGDVRPVLCRGHQPVHDGVPVGEPVRQPDPLHPGQPSTSLSTSRGSGPGPGRSAGGSRRARRAGPRDRRASLASTRSSAKPDSPTSVRTSMPAARSAAATSSRCRSGSRRRRRLARGQRRRPARRHLQVGPQVPHPHRRRLLGAQLLRVEAGETTTCRRARVTATLSRRSPPARLSGPKFSGSDPALVRR